MGPTNSELEQRTNTNVFTKDEENGIANVTAAAPDQSPEKDPEITFDSGLRSWLQVLGSFFLFFNSWYVYPNERKK